MEPGETKRRIAGATRLLAASLGLAIASGGCAEQKERPVFLWPSRSVPIANDLDVPFCGVALGVDEPPSMKSPFVDYLESPMADRTSLARRVPPHGEGTVLIPIPPPGRVVHRYELGVLDCRPDNVSGDIINRLDVDPDVEAIRVAP